MKRLVALLIMLFMVVSLVMPFSNVSNKTQSQNAIDEPIFLADITYEVVVEEIIEESSPYDIAIQEIEEKMSELDSTTDKKEWFLSYKDIVLKYAGLIDPPETIFDYFTEDEVRLICRVVETETYQCDFDSRVNVANVVLNRIEDGRFGDTVEEVITTKNQFAYCRGNITEDTILAVMFSFEIKDTTNGALFFHSNEKTNTFNGRNFIFQDNAGHNFY